MTSRAPQTINTDTAPTAATTQTLAVASLRRRFAAMLYDSFLLVAVFMAVTALAIVAATLVTGQSLNQGDFSDVAIEGWAYRLMLLASWFGFFTWFWCFSGQTLGMQAWRIKIVDARDDSQTTTLRQASTRLMMALVSALCLGLGYFWALRSPQRLSWHDSASNTRVVLLPKAMKSKATKNKATKTKATK